MTNNTPPRTTPRTTCPDCDSPLQAIKLIDATDRFRAEGTYRVNLTYGIQDEEVAAGGFFGGIAPQGQVYARLCAECGRILLYATPMKS